MWIEVNLVITLPGESKTRWRAVISREHIVSISLSDDPIGIDFASRNNGVTFETGTIELRDAIYKAWKLALQGKEMVLESIGFIRPLLSCQIEETYKFLQYQNLLNSMSDPTGSDRGWLAL